MPIKPCWILWRSDEVAVGMVDRVAKARILYRVPKEQRDGATIREEQPTSAEIAQGELVNAACVASVQRVSSAGEQPCVVTRIVAAQEGPKKTMRQALAASSAKEASAVSKAEEVLASSCTTQASAASDAEVVEKNQMGGEKPVLLIGSPMCQTFCGVITTMMWDAARVSEVKYKNFVEQCVRHPEEKEMCQVLGNAGRLFLHENLWNRLSRGLSFIKKMAEGVGMRKTKSELCRSQLAMCSPRTRSYLKSKSEYVIEELGMCCGNKEKRTKIHVKNVMMMVLRGLSYVAFTDSSNVMDSISVVVFDIRLMQESRLFLNQLDVYCRRPRQWESFVGMHDANRLEYRSRLCEKELKRLGFDVNCAMLVRRHGRSGLRMLAEHVVCLAL